MCSLRIKLSGNVCPQLQSEARGGLPSNIQRRQKGRSQLVSGGKSNHCKWSDSSGIKSNSDFCCCLIERTPHPTTAKNICISQQRLIDFLPVHNAVFAFLLFNGVDFVSKWTIWQLSVYKACGQRWPFLFSHHRPASKGKREKHHVLAAC